MIINKCCDVHVVIREKYGWKAYQSDKVKLLRSIDHSKLNTLVAGYSKKIKHIIKNIKC